MESDFYLVSTELREPFEARRCRLVKRVRSDIRDDLAFVEIAPPLPSEIYDWHRDLGYVVIASRLEGTSVFPLGNLPLPVYICGLKNPTNVPPDLISSDDLVLLDKGEIRKTASA
jgi:hypothetical protein